MAEFLDSWLQGFEGNAQRRQQLELQKRQEQAERGRLLMQQLFAKEQEAARQTEQKRQFNESFAQTQSHQSALESMQQQQFMRQLGLDVSEGRSALGAPAISRDAGIPGLFNPAQTITSPKGESFEVPSTPMFPGFSGKPQEGELFGANPNAPPNMQGGRFVRPTTPEEQAHRLALLDRAKQQGEIEAYKSRREQLRSEVNTFAGQFPEYAPGTENYRDLMGAVEFPQAFQPMTLDKKISTLAGKVFNPNLPPEEKKRAMDEWTFLKNFYLEREKTKAQFSPGWANFAQNQSVNQAATNLQATVYKDLSETLGRTPSNQELANAYQIEAARRGIPIDALIKADKSIPNNPPKESGGLKALLEAAEKRRKEKSGQGTPTSKNNTPTQPAQVPLTVTPPKGAQQIILPTPTKVPGVSEIEAARKKFRSWVNAIRESGLAGLAEN